MVNSTGHLFIITKILNPRLEQTWDRSFATSIPLLPRDRIIVSRKCLEDKPQTLPPSFFNFWIGMMFVNKIATWFQLKVVDPLLQILRRGTEPDQLALSAAVGFTLGIFPIVGVPIFLCGVAIAVLGPLCHAPSVMLSNFLITPVELSLIVPFLRFGEVITGGPHFALTSDALKKVLTGQASNEVLQSVFHALLGWLVAAPFIMAGLYVVLVPCCRFLVRKFSSVPLSPKRSDLAESELILKVRDV